MTTRVHYDVIAPKRERWRVLRESASNHWITTESFPTEREAHAFAQGFTLGCAYGAAAKAAINATLAEYSLTLGAQH